MLQPVRDRMNSSSYRDAYNNVENMVSIIIPTYNENNNILSLIEAIKSNLPGNISSEIIIVDDNSPDGTGRMVEDYIHRTSIAMASEIIKEPRQNHAKYEEPSHVENCNCSVEAHDDKRNYKNQRYSVKVVHRRAKLGLASAIVDGIESSIGNIIVVMDGDFSHPPQTIPSMIKELQLNTSKYDVVVASRYIEGGSIVGWPFKRKLMSKGATKIAQYGLGLEVKDPMSGFFAFRRLIIDGMKLDAIGYKMLLEILVKAKGVHIKEVPYTFTNRRNGESKLDSSVTFDYFKAIWRLYRYGKSLEEKEKRTSVRFLSKAGRFYTVGASGLIINYMVSLLFSSVIISQTWYLYSTIIGIFFSMTSNFFLNKIWTFEDRDLSVRHTLKQYGLFAGISILGAGIQLALIYFLMDSHLFNYGIALIIGVATASLGNFLLNKKITFRERIWR
jgi:dolichol-phosphate mannosyltransferase